MFAACFQHFQQMHFFPSAFLTQVDAVRKAEGDQLAWLPNALSAFINVRLQASRHETLKLMPVAIVASTLASATRLDSAFNSDSLVADIRIYPFTAQQMWELGCQPGGNGRDSYVHKMLIDMSMCGARSVECGFCVEQVMRTCKGLAFTRLVCWLA